ncbi:MAG TPA: glycosyltransferase [Acidimicrobiales bacterium]|nr:glycosyltransferase [Acidimicrobiales bacterium]
MRVFLWHVHGSWTTAFVQGGHEYFVPVLPDRGADGRGRAATWDWPDSVHEVSPQQARRLEVDVVVVQRADELASLAQTWLGRRPGRDLPCVYLEHNAPQGRVNAMLHPAAGRKDVHLVHVTHFNHLFWDCGSTPTVVIEHGIIDPGKCYSGELPRAGVVVNDPVRRGRVAGSDLIRRFQDRVGLDLFGMGTDDLGGVALSQDRLYRALGRRRVYLHLMRWTSLGLSLIEAMHIGMPVVALATTEAPEIVPAAAGVVSNRMDVLDAALEHFLHDPGAATAAGSVAREYALRRFGLKRFLDEWDALLEEVTAR